VFGVGRVALVVAVAVVVEEGGWVGGWVVCVCVLKGVRVGGGGVGGCLVVSALHDVLKLFVVTVWLFLWIAKEIPLERERWASPGTL
jgi:hypothetical protein